MRLLEGFGLSLLGLISSVFTIYIWIIIIRALISWVSPDPYNPVVQILYKLTEPVLRPLRRLVPPHKVGGLDLSPMIAILLLVLIRQTLVYTLAGPARF